MHILIHYIIKSHNSYIFLIYQREMSFERFISILDIDIRDVRARLSLKEPPSMNQSAATR